MNLRPLTSLLFLSVSITAVSAQTTDVCCIMGKKSGISAETSAVNKSPANCRPGAAGEEGFQICSAKQDPDNNCPNSAAEDRCKTCGFYWTGKECLSENPVKKAKEELKKENASPH